MYLSVAILVRFLCVTSRNEFSIKTGLLTCGYLLFYYFKTISQTIYNSILDKITKPSRDLLLCLIYLILVCATQTHHC